MGRCFKFEMHHKYIVGVSGFNVENSPIECPNGLERQVKAAYPPLKLYKRRKYPSLLLASSPS